MFIATLFMIAQLYYDKMNQAVEINQSFHLLNISRYILVFMWLRLLF